MPKLSVYLSDDLYAAARERHLPLSALLQSAVEAQLGRGDREKWVDRVAGRASTTTSIDTQRALDAIRDEFGE